MDEIGRTARDPPQDQPGLDSLDLFLASDQLPTTEHNGCLITHVRHAAATPNP